MIISIHQPNYFPWIGYFFKILKSDAFVFLDDVQFSKNSYINRAVILENKKDTWITIPVKKKLNYKINQVKIADCSWKKKHLSKIKNAYQKAKYFSEIWDIMEDLFTKLEYPDLASTNQQIIMVITKLLDIETNFFYSSEINNKEHEKGDDRLISIIKYLKGDIYFSGIGAKKYQDEKKFISQGIKLQYNEFIQKEYEQLSYEFIEGTSILDVLFNLGLKNTQHYLNEK